MLAPFADRNGLAVCTMGLHLRKVLLVVCHGCFMDKKCSSLAGIDQIVRRHSVSGEPV